VASALISTRWLANASSGPNAHNTTDHIRKKTGAITAGTKPTAMKTKGKSIILIDQALLRADITQFRAATYPSGHRLPNRNPARSSIPGATVRNIKNTITGGKRYLPMASLSTRVNVTTLSHTLLLNQLANWEKARADDASSPVERMISRRATMGVAKAHALQTR
jgi:hypothetical protein